MTLDSLLIANRGEIARRVIRTARAMGTRCVGVYVDADAGEPYVAECDEAWRLATGYLDVDALLEVARRAGARAVHPGYGFLSENAAFAQAVLDAGLVWVGPTPAVIAAMGDKIAAKALAREAGLPLLASSEDPEDAEEVGYPLLIKAAGGGGGKGMRVVTDADELPEALAAARREADHAFGDDRVFLEHYVAASRHVEIQILGDRHGTLVHLGERECSIQRRHQKLVEESPSPIVSDELRTAMGDAALALARRLDYESTGTVEFLVDDATRAFYFLEVNTRLQVEHPVTEEVFGVDLVREQLRVAAGEPLSVAARDHRARGHAIEVRLCAEDAAAGFLPATGTLRAFETPAHPAVRWESGVARGSTVGLSFDPLLAKVIAHAPTRAEAALALARALEGLHVGGVTTNRDVLAATLRHDAFLRGDTTTAFLERHRPARELVLVDDELARALVIGAVWLEREHRADAAVLADVPSGWRNARLPPQVTTLIYRGVAHEVHYRVGRDGTYEVGDGSRARVHHVDATHLDVEIDGRRMRTRVTHAGHDLFVQVPRGTAHLTIAPRFAVPGREPTEGGLDAPMPGLILDVRVTPGQRVVRGESLVVLEAMKMEHVIVAPHDGVVRDVLVAAGQQVERGVALLALESDGPSPSEEES
ncbi:MAG: biotin carboxylase N-terminal domain-containing protein [Acidimicrobiales bacterium]